MPEPLTSDAVRALIDATGHRSYSFQGRDYCAGCGDGYMRREPWAECPVRKLADAAAALAPRTLETAEEWEALPVGAIVRTSGGSVVTRFDATTAVLFGDERPYLWLGSWSLPAALLYAPAAPSPEAAAGV